MKNSSKFNYYYVQINTKEGPTIVAHSKDEETGELYHNFLSRGKANKLLKDQKKANPNEKYRVVREVKQYFATEWV